ncbi:MAG: hypothetical protein L2C94_004250 [Aigarchaeota archaeon]|nr:hypothetical protein [Candidatus Wolframiiraptor gerlachensis]
MEAEEAEKRIREIEEDLRFCEQLLQKEARMELVKVMLEDLMKEVKSIMEAGLPEGLRERVSDMEFKIRVLYHRANALLSLQEESRNSF